MASQELTELIQRADRLTPNEQLQLIAHLAEKAREAYAAPVVRSWREVQGAATYPLLEEDAQAWVSRNRQEEDSNRDHFGSGTQ